MNLKRNRRKDKRYLNQMRKIAAWGRYGIGCRGHPGIVIETDYGSGICWGEDFTLKSLVDGVEESCSLYHCGLDKLTKQQAEILAENFKK